MVNATKLSKSDRQFKLKQIIQIKDEELDLDDRTIFDKLVNMEVFKAAMQCYQIGYVDLDVSQGEVNEVKEYMCKYGTSFPPRSILLNNTTHKEIVQTDFLCKTHIHHFSEHYMCYCKMITNAFVVDGIEKLRSLIVIWIIDQETQRRHYVGMIQLNEDSAVVTITNEFFEAIEHLYPDKKYKGMIKELLGLRLTNLRTTVMKGWTPKKGGLELYRTSGFLRTEMVHNGTLTVKGIRGICSIYEQFGFKNPKHNFLKLYDIRHVY